MKIEKKDEFKTIRQYRNEIGLAIRPPLRFGLILLAIFFLGFGSWLVFAKLDKAAIATGEIVPVGSNRVVQHLEGGVIEQILVKEGDVVKQGQVLIKLSKTSASANVEIYDSALNTSVAEYSRLVAERDNLDAVKYPDEWMKSPDKYKSFMEAQNQIFKERSTGYKGKLSILDERTNQLQSEISGLKSQLAASQQQLEYSKKEITAVEKLLANGNTTMSRMLALKARSSEIEGSIGQLRSSIAKAEQAISENKLNKLNVRNETVNEVVEKIKDAQSRMNELKERGGNSSDILSRTEIRAPIGGIIKDMRFKTAESSGVIPPNSEVMTIVPTADQMLAEVKIQPNDIDVVRKPNLKARVRLSAYSARHIPMLNGILLSVSADVFKDPATQREYYKGRVSIDTSLMQKYLGDKPEINHEEYLYPGMPVEVYIVTGERSPFSYLVEPIKTDFRRAFREE